MFTVHNGWLEECLWNCTCPNPAVRISHLLTLAACCFRGTDQLFGLHKRRRVLLVKERSFNQTLVQNVLLTGFGLSSGLCGAICSWQDMSSSNASSHLKYFRIWTCKQFKEFLLESRFNDLLCCRATAGSLCLLQHLSLQNRLIKDLEIVQIISKYNFTPDFTIFFIAPCFIWHHRVAAECFNTSKWDIWCQTQTTLVLWVDLNFIGLLTSNWKHNPPP